MNLKENILCPICGAANHRVLYEPWQNIQDPVQLYGAASGIQGTQRLVKCENCEMIYENPRFPEPVIMEGYMSSKEAEHDSQYLMRVKSFYHTLKSLHAYLPSKELKILDIGTAGGAFLAAAQKLGHHPIGLEPSKFLVEQGTKRGFKIEQGTIDHHSFPQASFDMVCLWDVLEHLCNPKGALLKIKSLLRPKGILLINYPDIGTWQAKISGRRFWWIISVHLHHFTRDTLTKLCKKVGLKPFRFQRYWQILQLGYLEDMAIRYKIPFSKFFKRITPEIFQRISIPYYASQVTALFKVNS
ncbi:MAG: class I SAM-dependent methyltransferase [Chlamydiae bacterium]|nr:class I SAM-dependent methyltransferase [Chlamydiota bacterium]